MKWLRFTDSQISGILKQHEAGDPVGVLLSEHNVSAAEVWRHGRVHDEVTKKLEVENARLKKMYGREDHAATMALRKLP